MLSTTCAGVIAAAMGETIAKEAIRVLRKETMMKDGLVELVECGVEQRSKCGWVEDERQIFIQEYGV